MTRGGASARGWALIDSAPSFAAKGAFGILRHADADQFTCLFAIAARRSGAASAIYMNERGQAERRYWSSETCSSHSTTLPSFCSGMAMWVTPVVGLAPC